MDIATEYELKHWRHKGDAPDDRAERMARLFSYLGTVGLRIVADVGCGPRCGIFAAMTFPRMYAVDPLWPQYDAHRLVILPASGTVCRLTATAETLALSEPADAIVTVNALDHSGNLTASIANLLKPTNLRAGGLLAIHVHLRTKAQLNEGHRMLLTERMMDRQLRETESVMRFVKECCPIDGKPYQSYVTIVRTPGGN